MITVETATQIALAHREIETGQKLLEDVKEVVQRRGEINRDLRDVFGRNHDALELGVPSGDTSKRLFRVPYELAVPVIEAHILSCRSRLAALNEKARLELEVPGDAA